MCALINFGGERTNAPGVGPYRSKRRQLLAPALVGLLGLLTAACNDTGGEEQQYPTLAGDPERGAWLVERIGCGSCHVIPGIQGADGLVGPPLNRMGRRIYVAGVLRNTPENMMFWLQNPQLVVPGNAMPDMRITREQAEDITAYLYTLR